jgi:hypothetical protein
MPGNFQSPAAAVPRSIALDLPTTRGTGTSEFLFWTLAFWVKWQKKASSLRVNGVSAATQAKEDVPMPHG